jgi:hypothetical protein
MTSFHAIDLTQPHARPFSLRCHSSTRQFKHIIRNPTPPTSILYPRIHTLKADVHPPIAMRATFPCIAALFLIRSFPRKGSANTACAYSSPLRPSLVIPLLQLGFRIRVQGRVSRVLLLSGLGFKGLGSRAFFIQI